MQRDSTLDVLRCILVFLIVCLHFCKYELCQYGTVKFHVLYYLRALTTIGVPGFLLITGYYLPVIFKKDKFKSYFTKILRLSVVASLFYLAMRLVWYYLQHGDVFLSMVINASAIRNFLLFNIPISAGYHLWYLYALIYSLAIIYVLYRWGVMGKVVRAIVSLFVCFAVYAAVSGLADSLKPAFVFLSLPLICIGMMMREYLSHILGRGKAFDIVAICVCVVSLITLGVEAYSRPRYLIDGYLSTLILIVAIMLLAVRHSALLGGSVLSKIGLHHSTNIYVLQVAVADAIFLVEPGLLYLPLIATIAVFAVSLIASLILGFLSRQSFWVKQDAQ